MNLDHIFRIGVDKWHLKNISLEYPPEYKKMEFLSDGSLREGIEIRESEFVLSSFTRLRENGDLLPEITILTFNPNTVLDGHNICNSRRERTLAALEKIRKQLKEKNIIFDYSKTKVDTLELQINFNKPFKEMEKFIDLLFSVFSKGKSKKVLGDRFERHLISSRPTESFFWTEYLNVHRAYDKTAEINQNREFYIELQITRMEYKPSPYKIRKLFEENGLDINLQTVLNNFEILDNFFKDFWFSGLQKTFKYLEGEYTKELERGYLKYKNIQNTAKRRGEKVPRGIYKYIKENYEIYDSYYLKEIIKKYDSKHIGREIEKINNYFDTNNSLEILEYLNNFFCTLKTN